MIVTHLGVEELLSRHVELLSVVQQLACTFLGNKGNKSGCSLNDLLRKIACPQRGWFDVNKEPTDEDAVALKVV